MLALSSLVHSAAWCSSGASTMTMSACLAASAGDMTLNLAASAFAAVAEPGRSATITSLTPLSRRFWAWAWPWLP